MVYEVNPPPTIRPAAVRARQPHDFPRDRPPDKPLNCHFEGAPHGTLPYDNPRARLRNLLSASSWPADTPPHRPCQADAPPNVRRGLPRLTPHNPMVDSSALPPLGRTADAGAAGPRNDRPVASSERMPTLTKSSHPEGGATRQPASTKDIGADRRTFFRPAASPICGRGPAHRFCGQDPSVGANVLGASRFLRGASLRMTHSGVLGNTPAGNQQETTYLRDD
jgi:hypothetical protein